MVASPRWPAARGDITLTGPRDAMRTPLPRPPARSPDSGGPSGPTSTLSVVFYEMLTGGLPLGQFEPHSRGLHMDVRMDEVVLAPWAQSDRPLPVGHRGEVRRGRIPFQRLARSQAAPHPNGHRGAAAPPPIPEPEVGASTPFIGNWNTLKMSLGDGDPQASSNFRGDQGTLQLVSSSNPFGIPTPGTRRD